MNANLCKNNGFEDLIVSYIYDEATTDERHRLETHILDCFSCMEEFAGLANARLSVFEWQKEGFSGLETPVIALPSFAADLQKIDEGTSFLGRLQGLLDGIRGPAFAFGAVLVLIAAGFSFIFLSTRRSTEQPIAAKPPMVNPAPAINPATEVASPVLTAEENEREFPTNPTVKVARDESRVLKAVSRPLRSTRQLTAKAEKPRRTPQQDRKAPVLANFAETSDRSLRLSDLFDDEIGSIHN